jgi:hypothetical protein
VRSSAAQRSRQIDCGGVHAGDGRVIKHGGRQLLWRVGAHSIECFLVQHGFKQAKALQVLFPECVAAVRSFCSAVAVVL